MAKRRRSASLFGKSLWRRPVQRGIMAVVTLAVLFLIGFLSPELRDKLLPPANTGPLPPPAESKVSPLREGVWPVVRIVDGDTLIVQDDGGKQHRIRLIGADTPETVKPNHPVEPYGPEASAFTKQRIAESGDRVRVAFDGDQIDRFERTLAMIYLQTPGGEVLLNELLIREGLAKAQTKYRYSEEMKERFRAAENAAKAERRNIWSGKQ